jgi:hypothetical protein
MLRVNLDLLISLCNLNYKKNILKSKELKQNKKEVLEQNEEPGVVSVYRPSSSTSSRNEIVNLVQTYGNNSSHSFSNSSRNECIIGFNSERYQLDFISPEKASRALLNISSIFFKKFF